MYVVPYLGSGVITTCDDSSSPKPSNKYHIRLKANNELVVNAPPLFLRTWIVSLCINLFFVIRSRIAVHLQLYFSHRTGHMYILFWFPLGKYMCNQLCHPSFLCRTWRGDSTTRVQVEQVYLYIELLAELESSRSPKLRLPFFGLFGSFETLEKIYCTMYYRHWIWILKCIC
jgi:hypothetical protein